MILSDTHLGRPRRGAQSAQALRGLWQGADRLIINGDVAEVHDQTCRGAAARQVIHLQDMCEADGVKLTLISGNHDPFMTDRRHLSLAGGEVFVTHGDAIHPAISPWTSHRQSLRRLHSQAVAAVQQSRGPQADVPYATAQYASLLQWDAFATYPHCKPSWATRYVQHIAKTGRVLWYWHTLPRNASAFAHWHAPHCRFFIFGHIHRAGIWRQAGRVLINTGSYDWPGRPRAVVIENGFLAVHAIQRERGRYHLAQRPLRRYALYSRSA